MTCTKELSGVRWRFDRVIISGSQELIAGLPKHLRPATTAQPETDSPVSEQTLSSDARARSNTRSRRALRGALEFPQRGRGAWMWIRFQLLLPSSQPTVLAPASSS